MCCRCFMVALREIGFMTSPNVETAAFTPNIDDPRPFPDSERVIYGKNPLESVICQVRFPAILKISSEPPADFQEPLRKSYPLFREIPPIDVGTGWPPELSAIIAKVMPTPTARAYELSSGDSSWQITLTQDSLALACKKYARWEDFTAHFIEAFNLLIQIYSPSFLTRIGLRYRNVIARYPLGLQNVAWSELLSPDLAGEFHSRITSSVDSTGHQLVLHLQGDVAKVTLQHGLGNRDGDYLIDSDFYLMERTGVQNAGRVLDYFNRQAGRLFRWCIADRLHRAMEPNPIS